MPQKPISEMSHKPGRMSEEADYTLQEMKHAINALTSRIEKNMSLEDIQPLINAMSTLTTQEDFMSLVSDYNKRVVDCPSSNSITESLSILSNKIDGLKDAIVTLGQKMDSEDVANLDTDYETIINSKLI